MIYHQVAKDARGRRVEVPGGLRKKTARYKHDDKLRLIVYYFDADVDARAEPFAPARDLRGAELTAFWALLVLSGGALGAGAGASPAPALAQTPSPSPLSPPPLPGPRTAGAAALRGSPVPMMAARVRRAHPYRPAPAPGLLPVVDTDSSGEGSPTFPGDGSPVRSSRRHHGRVA